MPGPTPARASGVDEIKELCISSGAHTYTYSIRKQPKRQDTLGHNGAKSTKRKPQNTEKFKTGITEKLINKWSRKAVVAKRKNCK